MNNRTQNTPDDNTFEPVEGQYVSCMHRSWTARRTGIVVAVVPPAAAEGHDYVGYVVQYPPSPDEHPAVQALAIYNGQHRSMFRAEELQPVSSDDAPPATDAEVVEHITGVLAPDEPRNVDEYECPVDGCDFHILAAGPVDIDEPDPFQESIDEHVRGHEPEVDEFRCPIDGFTTAVDEDQDAHVRAHMMEDKGMHPGWGDVGAVDFMLAAHGLFGIFDIFPMSRPPAEVAAKLHAVARVLEGGAP